MGEISPQLRMGIEVFCVALLWAFRFVSLCRRRLAIRPSPFGGGMGITRRHKRRLGGCGKKVRSMMGS